MLDPLTALSLAGNILQVVDFSTKIICQATRLYQSTSDTLDADSELSLVISDLSKFCDLIEYPSASAKGLRSTENDIALQSLCQACRQVVTELLARLDKLKVSRSKGDSRAWASLNSALLWHWKKAEREDLVKRLSTIREQVQLRVVVGLRQQLDILSVQQSRYFENLDQANQGILTALLATETKMVRKVEDASQALQNQSLAISQLLGSLRIAVDSKATIVDSAPSTLSAGKDPAPNVWTHEVDYLIRRHVDKTILDSLAYPEITLREEQIRDTYASTFQWIFKDPTDQTPPWDSFVDWLETGSGTYWISGKAASGKSTLMRYIYQHPRMRELLQSWGGQSNVRIAKFYFWNSGTPEQRSQSGLLRSLLMECLLHEPELIPIIFSSLWARLYSELVAAWSEYHSTLRRDYSTKGAANNLALEGKETWFNSIKSTKERSLDTAPESRLTWSLKSLMDAFNTLLKHDEGQSKLCFFIDGLDEYEGDHALIAELFITVATSRRVKICVSSRPLLPFDDAFGSGPSLRLQDLTERDINLYVTTNFHSNRYFQSYFKESPSEATEMINGIVSKADGVFLWITLVVHSLLVGLSNRDDVSDLQRRIDDLPPDLESIFHHMFTRIPDFYKKEFSQVIQIVNWTNEFGYILDLVTLSLCLEHHTAASLQAPPAEIPTEQIVRRCQRMKDRLKVISLGLLEYSALGCHDLHHRGEQACATVRYIHRTAFDFINSPEIKNSLLLHTSGTGFDPNTVLLQSCIMRMKGKIDHALAASEGLAFSVITTSQSYVFFLKSENPDHILLNELLSVRNPKFDFSLSPLLHIYMYARRLLLDESPDPNVDILNTFFDIQFCSTQVVKIEYSLVVQVLLAAHKLSKRQPFQEHERLLLSHYARIIKLYTRLESIEPLRLNHKVRTARSIAMETFSDHLPDEAQTIDKMFAARGVAMEIRQEKGSRFHRWSPPGLFKRRSGSHNSSEPKQP
ncbi:hypothetical protein EG329_008860 [Mollisiaceae sp. DMI_Dod_QoI]|nr:hypothetical protein EG329_008860 [Helotiales sp. DMI_Dod_QoI]